MVLDAFFRRASETFPIPVMLRALLERVFEPARLNDWFEAVTEKQYTRELLFSSAFELMSVVVFKAFGSVHAAYQAKRTAGEITVSVTSVYNKLNGVEAQTSRALVRDTAGHLRHLVEDVQGGCRPWLPGYRVKVLDGNCIAATEHRLQVLRTTAAGPLPGKALVVYDPAVEMAIDVFPCEDGHAQERALLGEVVPTVQAGEGAALLRRGVFALFMGLFARGCVSPVLISGGQQPSQRVPASFRRPAEPRNGAEHRRSVPLRRAPFWTFARRSGTVPWEGRQTCDGCDDRIPGTYIRRAPNLRPLHRSPEASPVRSGRCCLRGCQSLPLVQRSPADERERTRTGTAPAGPGVGTQAPARTSRPTQPERGCWSGRGHQRCRVLGAARARKPRRNDLRHDAGCGSGLRAARSRRLASARCRAEPAAGALLGRDAPPRDHRDRLAGTTAYALEATVVLDIIHVAAATRRAVLVAGSSKGLSAFGPRPDGSRPARGDIWLQLRRSSAAAGSRSLDAY